MKIFILGSNGMAGHTIVRYFKEYTPHTIYTIARSDARFNVDIENDIEYLGYIIKIYKPDYIINCIGLLIQDSKKQPHRAIYINAYFPHWLERITWGTSTKIIHLSTNCVFQEDKGNYFDVDIPDGDSWYAKTKAMGEIKNDKDLTIRLSIIGTELKSNGTGLLSWFLRQTGTISGYSKCFWNGITCLCLAKNIDKMIEANVVGLYQLAPSYTIDKYSLCQLFKQVWNKDIKITRSATLVKNGTLVNSSRDNFEPIFPDTYEEMLRETKKFTEKNED